MSLGAVFPWRTHIMFSFLTRHFDVLLIFPFVTCLVPLQFKWYYSQLVKQTDQKEETAKSSETVQCQHEHIFKGHRGDLLWQHLRLKLTLLCNKNKLNWENRDGGWGRVGMKRLSSQTTSKSHWSKESHKGREKGESSETEWNWQRCKQRYTKRGWNKTWERCSLGKKIGAKYTGNEV